MHRDFEPGSDQRDEGSLSDHGKEDNDEDDPVDAVGGLNVVEYREGGEEDRYGPLEPAPGNERSFAKTEAKRRQEDGDDKWACEQCEGEKEDGPFEPDPSVEGRDRDRQPEGDEHGQFGQAREG